MADVLAALLRPLRRCIQAGLLLATVPHMAAQGAGECSCSLGRRRRCCLPACLHAAAAARARTSVRGFTALDWLGVFLPCVRWLRTYKLREYLLVRRQAVCWPCRQQCMRLLLTAAAARCCLLPRQWDVIAGISVGFMVVRMQCSTEAANSSRLPATCFAATPAVATVQVQTPLTPCRLLPAMPHAQVPQGMSYANMAGLPSVYGL